MSSIVITNKFSTSTGIDISLLVQIGRAGQILKVIADNQPALPTGGNSEFDDKVAGGFSRDNEHVIQGNLNHWCVVRLLWTPGSKDVCATARRMGNFVGAVVNGCPVLLTNQKRLEVGRIVLSPQETALIINSIEPKRIAHIKVAVAEMYKATARPVAVAPSLETMSVEAVAPKACQPMPKPKPVVAPAPKPVEKVIVHVEPVKPKASAPKAQRRAMPAHEAICAAEEKILVGMTARMATGDLSDAPATPASVKGGSFKGFDQL